MKLGYLGPRTNSEIAAQRVHSIDSLVSFRSMEDVFEGMRQGKVEKIIVPVCNSLTGDIKKYKDLIVQYGFSVEEELTIAIKHCLGAYDGDTSVVISHEEVLKQCREYLDEHYPLVRRESTKSTEEAARIVAEQKEGIAIANLETCLYYGLKVIDEHIVEGNYSTFAVLGIRFLS